MGRACSLVQLSSTAAVDSLQDAAKKLAMHVVAAKPQYLSSKDVPVEVIEKEKAIFRSVVVIRIILFSSSILLCNVSTNS